MSFNIKKSKQFAYFNLYDTDVKSAADTLYQVIYDHHNERKNMDNYDSTANIHIVHKNCSIHVGHVSPSSSNELCITKDINSNEVHRGVHVNIAVHEFIESLYTFDSNQLFELVMWSSGSRWSRNKTIIHAVRNLARCLAREKARDTEYLAEPPEENEGLQ